MGHPNHSAQALPGSRTSWGWGGDTCSGDRTCLFSFSAAPGWSQEAALTSEKRVLAAPGRVGKALAPSWQPYGVGLPLPVSLIG